MKTVLFVVAALFVFSGVAVAGKADFGVPFAAHNGVKNAVKADGSLRPFSVGEHQLKNEIIGCEKLAKYLRPRVCGRVLSVGNPVNGVNGKDGANGANGADGLQGALGATGDTGATGATGEQGKTGERGPRGYKGYRGYTGDKGPKGDKGDKGDTGPPGKDGQDGNGLGNDTLTICLDGKGGINQAPCNGEQKEVKVVIVAPVPD